MFFSHKRKVATLRPHPGQKGHHQATASTREREGGSLSWRVGMQIRVATVRPVCWLLNRLNTEPSHAPALPLLSLRALVTPSRFLNHGTVHHSQKAAAWHPTTDEWTKKIHTAKCHSAVHFVQRNPLFCTININWSFFFPSGVKSSRNLTNFKGLEEGEIAFYVLWE